jgi:hypothetical protein
MYLQGQLSDTLCLEIYHSEKEDAEDDDCELILIVETDEAFEAGEAVFLNGETYPLEQVIEQFNLNRFQVMWVVAYDSA